MTSSWHHSSLTLCTGTVARAVAPEATARCARSCRACAAAAGMAFSRNACSAVAGTVLAGNVATSTEATMASAGMRLVLRAQHTPAHIRARVGFRVGLHANVLRVFTCTHSQLHARSPRARTMSAGSSRGRTNFFCPKKARSSIWCNCAIVNPRQ